MIKATISSIDEEFRKSRVKGFVRTRKGKLERVKEFERKDGKRDLVESASKEIVKGMDNVMRIFKQSKGMCGPASIRIALSKFNKSFNEKEIAKFAKSTAAEGTTHDNLVSALKQAGVHALVYENLSPSYAISVLTNSVNMGDPVIVDWMKTKLGKGGDVKASEGMKPGEETAKTKKDIAKEGNEHYSVVSKVDDNYITLLDPLESKEEKLPIDYFIDRWSTISEEKKGWHSSEKIKRWFVVLSAGDLW